MRATIAGGCRLRLLCTPDPRRHTLLLLGLALTAACAPAPSSAQSSKDASSLDKKVAAVLPSKEEDRWLEIEWHTNIAEARREAERQGKPVLLWVMNGNPLG